MADPSETSPWTVLLLSPSVSRPEHPPVGRVARHVSPTGYGRAIGIPLPAPGWEVAYEGQPVATYAEEPDGWLHQIGSSRLDASLGRHVGAWDSAKAYPNLDDLREAYVLRAKVWEGRQAGKGAPGFSDREG